MSKIKLAIVFYSMGGTNYQMAKWAKAGAETVDAEVKLFKVQELAPEGIINTNKLWKKTVNATKDIPVADAKVFDWADAMIISAPTRFGVMASQMKQFFDTNGGAWAQGKLANKPVSAMSSAQNPHGGQEATILSLYTTLMHWGALIVPPGYTDPSIGKAGGNPYGTSVSVNNENKMVEDIEEAVKYQAARTVKVAQMLEKGK